MSLEAPKKSYLIRLSTLGFWLCLMVFETAVAEEGGGGHYLPGSIASSVDATLTDPAFVVRLNVIEYDGEVNQGITVPIAGLAAVDADVDLSVIGLTLAWRPQWSPSEDLSFAMSATLPYVDLTVTATVVDESRTISVQRSENDSAIGDAILMPLMLNYKINDFWRTDFRLAFYAPTGSYSVGSLANTGKNYWSTEPTVGLFYNNPKKGREFTVFGGMTFNQENPDTDYRSGTQAHVESTFVQHFPLLGGLGGIGATGYYYQQITGDSGDGATFGDFKGRTAGIGPVFSYIKPLKSMAIVAELKWLHEFDVKRRPEGDYLYFKLLAKF